jgi:hypothetical protein
MSPSPDLRQELSGNAAWMDVPSSGPKNYIGCKEEIGYTTGNLERKAEKSKNY